MNLCLQIILNTSQLCSILSSHHDNCILMSGGRAWVSGRGLVWLYTLCTLVLVAEAWTESSLSEIALGFCQSTSSQVDTVTDTGPFSCNWPGFNPAHPDVTPCGDDYLKVLLLEGWCPVTREWGHGKEPHDSNGLWPRGLWPLHWDNRNLCLQTNN